MVEHSPYQIGSFRPETYLARAGECARLADLTDDDVLKRALRLLQAMFLQTAAERCREYRPRLN